MNSSEKHCQCGAELAPESLGQLCPACLFNAAQQSSVPPPEADPAETDTRKDEATHADRLKPELGARIRYFGDYELLDEIARGGMGVVYRARQLSLNRTVAIKMILGGQLAAPRELRRFRLEAESAASLQYPNIVSIHEVGEHNGLHYFSMDLVEGEDLSKLLKRGALDSDQAASIARKVCAAVAFAHKCGILHRNLKPSNVLLDKDGEPRVTDFGLAKRQSETTGMTVSGAVLGTPSYMAPEQAEGRLEEIDRRTDVFGLGAMLYEMLAGRPPFTGDTPVAVMRQVVERNPDPPSRTNFRAPRDLEAICMKCLQKNPLNRYQSATELGEDLDRFLRHDRVLARPPARAMAWVDWFRRNPDLISLGVYFLAIGLSVGVFTFWDYSRLLLWKAAHPGQQPGKPGFFEILGWTGERSEDFGYLLFLYLIAGPPVILAIFAMLKMKSKLMPHSLLFFAVTAKLNLLLGLAALMLSVHQIVWKEEDFSTVLGPCAAMLPCLFFTFQLARLLFREVRVWHFGERESEASQVYGKFQERQKDVRGFNRTAKNLEWAGWITLLVMTQQLGWLPTVMALLGMGGWAAFILHGIHHRERILALAIGSSIDKQFAVFIGVLMLPLIVGIPFTTFGMIRIGLWNSFTGVTVPLCSMILGGCCYVLYRRSRNEPREWLLRHESSFGIWCESHSWSVTFFIPFFAVMVLSFFSFGVNGFVAFIAGCFIPGDALMAVRADPSRRRSVFGTLTLAAIAAIVSLTGLPPSLWWSCLSVGILLGSVVEAVHVATLPANSKLRSTLQPLSLGLAALGLLMLLGAGSTLSRWPSQALSYNKLFMETDFKLTTMLPTKTLYSTPLREFRDAYRDLGFLRQGVRHFERITLHPRLTSEAWFTTKVLHGEMLHRLGLPSQAREVFAVVDAKFPTIDAHRFQIGLPKAGARNPIESALINHPEPIETIGEAGWQFARTDPGEYPGTLNLRLQDPGLAAAYGVSTNRSGAWVWVRLFVVADESRDIELRMASDDQIAVWWNGEARLRKRHSRPAVLDQDLVRVTMNRGTNVFLAATGTFGGYWTFQLRTTLEDGNCSLYASGFGLICFKGTFRCGVNLLV